jgi:hypothetical protein
VDPYQGSVKPAAAVVQTDLALGYVFALRATADEAVFLFSHTSCRVGLLQRAFGLVAYCVKLHFAAWQFRAQPSQLVASAAN